MLAKVYQTFQLSHKTLIICSSHLIVFNGQSRLTIVSCEAKKKHNNATTE